MSDDDEQLPKQLRDIKESLMHGGTDQTTTVRTLLSWFDAQRRGSQVKGWIDECLTGAGLRTEPDFREAWIDGDIEFHLLPEANPNPPGRHESQPSIAEIGGEAMVTANRAVTPTFDPTNRISRLVDTNRPVTGVSPDSDISEAITLMLQHDYSQLPVWINDRNVKGIISWKSIASRVAVGLDYSKVRHCMEPHRDVTSEAPLFDVIALIVEHGYVLVKATDGRISGIVTASDLSLQFRQLAEPFLLLGEIEQHIRKILSNNVPIETLRNARDPADSDRSVEKVSDLSLGETIRLLENPDVWQNLGLPYIDRKTVIADLHKIRAIRNEVMHFDPDPLGNDSIQFLSNFCRFMQRLDKVRSR